MSFETLEALAFSLAIIQKEGRRFNVDINPTFTRKFTNSSDVNFDMAHNRCSYMYRCGTISLCFAKDCYSKFLSSSLNVEQLMHQWENCPNLTACSISRGPALDYIALLLSLNKKAMLFSGLVKNIKLITKHGAWRNTTNIMLEVLRTRKLKSLPQSLLFENIEVFQGDPFKELTEKIKDPIANSDIVMITKTLNLSPDNYDQKAVSKSLQLFIDVLKPGALLFCIDTKMSVTEITQVLSAFPGNFLFEPTHMNTMINLELEVEVKELPVVSARGVFFVWQKSSVPTCGVGKLKESLSLLSEKSFGNDHSGLLAEATSKCNAVGATAPGSPHPSKSNDQQWTDNFSNYSQGSSMSVSSDSPDVTEMSSETMEALAFFVAIIQKEGRRFNVDINPSFTRQLNSSSDVNFDIAHNRCSYMYRCGTISLCFAKDCYNKFLSSSLNVEQLMHKWENSPNLTACSISKGPVLDYIALLLSLNEKGMLFPLLAKNIKLITKHGAWRNTTNIMLEVLHTGYLRSLPRSLPFENIEVFQGDPFKELTEKIKDPIANSDILMMTKALNLSPGAYDQKAVSKSLQLFIDVLKPGAVLFCIDSKMSVTEITQVLSAFPGNYLFEPTFMNTLINLELGVEVKELNCLPVVSARGVFFVWQKSSVPTSDMGKLKEPLSLLSEKSSGNDHSGLLAEAISKCNAVGATASGSPHPSKSNDQQWTDNFSNYSRGSSMSLSSDSPEIKLQIDNFVKSKRDYFKTDSVETSMDQSTQTENEDSEEAESVEISQLTNRIDLLTAELSDVLETNISNGCLNDCRGRSSEAACNCLTGCGYSHPLNRHGCPNSKFQSCMQNCDLFNYSQNHCKCKQVSFTPNQYGSNISLNKSAGNFCCASQRLELPTGDNSPSVPQLVIPLNNLSADVLTQIVSLLNQCKL